MRVASKKRRGRESKRTRVGTHGDDDDEKVNIDRDKIKMGIGILNCFFRFGLWVVRFLWGFEFYLD